MLLVASCLGTICIVALVRLAPLALWGRPGLTSGDVMGHLNLIDHCREQRATLPDLSSKFLVSDREDYPTFYHRLLSLLPQRTVDVLEPAFGTIVECLHAAVLFGFAYVSALQFLPSPWPLAVAVLSTLLFATTPLLLGIENHGRVYRLSPRPVGALLTSTALLSFMQFELSQNLAQTSLWQSGAWLLVASVAGGLAALSSKFAVQALVFLCTFIAIIGQDVQPLVLPVSSILAAIALSGGAYLRIARGHIRHSYVYCTYLRKRYRAANRGAYTELLRLPLQLATRPKEALRCLATNHLIISVLLVPWVLIPATSKLAQPALSDPAMTSVDAHLTNWILAGYCSLLVTTLPWFRFLGEGSRYIIYSVDAICILAAIHLSVWLSAGGSPVLWYVTAAAVALALAGTAASWWTARLVKSSDPDREALYAWIRQQPASTMVTIDLRLSFLLCFRTPHRAVQCHSNAPSGAKLGEYKSLIPRLYPWPTIELSGLIDRYGVDMIVVDDRALEIARQGDQSHVYDLSGYTQVFQQGRFRVLRVPGLPTAAAAA